MLHYTSKKQDPISISFFSYGLCSLFSFILLLFQLPGMNRMHIGFLLNWHEIAAILLFSIFSIGNQTARVLAYARINKAASLAPFIYSALIFTAFIDWVWLGILPMWYTYVGIAIIILSGVIMSIRIGIVFKPSQN